MTERSNFSPTKGVNKAKSKINKNQVGITARLDTTLKQYEQDGGDQSFIDDVTKSAGVHPSQMKITKKREGSVILSFIVKTPT